MNYSINLYLKNKKKFQTINSLVREIEDINMEKNNFDRELNDFRDRMIRDLAGKTIKTGVTYESRSLVIGKCGFGTLDNYSTKSRFHSIDEKFLTFLRTHKLEFNSILAKIKKEEKKQVLSIFVRNAQDEKKTVREFKMKVGKNIIDPDDMKSASIAIIRTEMGRSTGVEMRAIKDDGGSFGIDDSESIENNMIKEQLYLPIWKLLIKMKRYAFKQRKNAEKRFKRMKKELEPFWVLDKIAEVNV